MSLITVDNLDKFYRGMQSKSIFNVDFVGVDLGDDYEITSENEEYSGDVPQEYEIVQTVKELNTTYRVSVVHNGETYYTDVLVGDTYGSYDITVNASLLSSIEVRTQPNINQFKVGDYLDTTGIEITGNYENGIALDVTDDCVFGFSEKYKLQSTDTFYTVSYTESGVTKTVNIPITVVDDIAILNDRIEEVADVFVRPIVNIKNSEGAYMQTSTGEKLEITTFSQAELASMINRLIEEEENV